MTTATGSLSRVAMIATLLLLVCPTAIAQPSGGAASAPPADPRQLVTMPEAARALMRQDMLDHLMALNQVFAALAAGDFAGAAEATETRLGRGSMGKFRATGMGPGRFMPLEMRNLGWSMHDAASELAQTIKGRDPKAIHAGLQKLMSACASCHLNYRTY